LRLLLDLLIIAGRNIKQIRDCNYYCH